MLFAAVCVSAWLWKYSAIWSAVLGGLSYLIPTLLAMLTIIAAKKLPALLPALLPATLLMAEISKILMICLMMLLVYVCYSAVNWFAFLTGLILVSQAGLFTFRKRLLL
ncbi:ATP synthase subunit I [Snodgrassella alvi]|uniref:ATP synthase subunit I n=1 Tax=Snodgrassella alvi TaxID=1196083 RepID=UPI0034E8CE7E